MSDADKLDRTARRQGAIEALMKHVPASSPPETRPTQWTGSDPKPVDPNSLY
jgi:hypothetical protein